MKKFKLFLATTFLVFFSTSSFAKGSLDNLLKGLNVLNNALQTQQKTLVYDTIYKTENQKVLIKSEYKAESPQRTADEIFIHSNTGLATRPRDTYNIPIPKKRVNGLTEKEVVAVYYWFDVDQQAVESMRKGLNEIAKGSANAYLQSHGLGAIGSFIQNSNTQFIPRTKENVQFKVVYNKFAATQWLNSHYIGDLKSARTFNETIEDLDGKDGVYLCFYNDNLYMKISIYVTYCFVYEIKTYEMQETKVVDKISPIYK